VKGDQQKVPSKEVGMMPVLDELELRRAFNSFCKKLLRNEAINAIVALQRRKNTVLNFSDINFDEEVMVGSYDRTIDPDTEYLVQGRKISNAQLIKAINQLAEPYRKVIEYYYFYELNDRLISIMLGVSRSTVQSRRSKALGWLRKDLEENSDVCNTNS